RCRRETPHGQHRTPQKTPPRQTLLRDLCRLSSTTMQFLVLLRRYRWPINIIDTHNSLFPCLKVKVDAVLPRPCPQPARTSEEATRQCNHRPEHDKHRERYNSYLTIRIRTAWIAVDIG